MLLAELSNESAGMACFIIVFVAIVMGLFFARAGEDDSTHFCNKYVDHALVNHLESTTTKPVIQADIRRTHYRSLMIRDELMLLHRRACEILDVDPSEDSSERDVIDDLILNHDCDMDVDKAIRRLDAIRYARRDS